MTTLASTVTVPPSLSAWPHAGVPARRYRRAGAWRRWIRSWTVAARNPHVGRAFIGGSLEGLLGGQAALIGLAGVGATELGSGVMDVSQGLAAGIFAHAAVENASTEAFLAHSHGHGGDDHGDDSHGSHGQSHGHDSHGHGQTSSPDAAPAAASISKVPQLAGAASTVGLVGGAALPLTVAAVSGSVLAGAVTGGVGLFALGALATAKYTGRGRLRSGFEHLKLGAVASGFYYAASTGAQALATGAGLASLGPVLPAAIGIYAGLKGVRWMRRRQQRKRAARVAAMMPPAASVYQARWAQHVSGRVAHRGHGHGHSGHAHGAADSRHSHEHKRASGAAIR